MPEATHGSSLPKIRISKLADPASGFKDYLSGNGFIDPGSLQIHQFMVTKKGFVSIGFPGFSSNSIKHKNFVLQDREGTVITPNAMGHYYVMEGEHHIIVTSTDPTERGSYPATVDGKDSPAHVNDGAEID